jgi:hypothetical protein
MYLHTFPLYFCFNLRRKYQEPNPGVNRVLPVINSWIRYQLAQSCNTNSYINMVGNTLI